MIHSKMCLYFFKGYKIGLFLLTLFNTLQAQIIGYTVLTIKWSIDVSFLGTTNYAKFRNFPADPQSTSVPGKAFSETPEFALCNSQRDIDYIKMRRMALGWEGILDFKAPKQ